LNEVECALRQSYLRWIRIYRQDVVQLVDDALTRFKSDAEAAANAEALDDDSEYGALQQPEDARSHRSAAVAILEKAFEHAQAITIAEKQRLAAATGLEPRQVTIWVSPAIRRRAWVFGAARLPFRRISSEDKGTGGGGAGTSRGGAIEDKGTGAAAGRARNGGRGVRAWLPARRCDASLPLCSRLPR
jgi:hypothetical protein